ncbi:MAG: aminoglycoside phosphotransferase family protein [Clostridia bacterium]
MNLERIIAVRTSKTIYKDGGTVIKLFDKDYSKADVLNEALNQSRVEQTGLNIPKVRSVNMLDGKWSITMDYIAGQPLDKLMLKYPEKTNEYLNLFVDLQMTMHGCVCPLLNKLKDKMDRKIDETTLDATIRYELHTRLNGMPKHARLCHGDYNPSNIIVGDDGKLYILDWSHATQGDGNADVARTYLLFRLQGGDLADKYLKMFCKKSDTPKQAIQQWLPIVAASQSVKGKPEEREFLLKWVDVVDFE